MQFSEPFMFHLTETQISPKASKKSLLFFGYELHTSFHHGAGMCVFFSTLNQKILYILTRGYSQIFDPINLYV